MIVRCLKPFSTGTFAMEQYEIRDVDDTLAAKLISAGLVQEVGGGSSGVLVVHVGENNALDKTWAEINAADVAVVLYSGSEDGETWHGREFVTNTSTLNGNYFVSAVHDGGSSDYMATDPDGYPIRQD